MRLDAVALLLAVALDHLFGDPPNRVHPVAWMGSTIALLRDRAPRGRASELLWGALMVLVVPLPFVLVSAAALKELEPWPVASLLATAVLLKPTFAVRGLRDAAFVVRDALDRGDLAGGRAALASLCSRNAASLDPPALVAATVESIAENASDSVVAPLFYYVLFGVPGAVLYRAVNTLDAMIGYRGRFEYLGKAAARADDVLNFVPARLTAALLLVAGLLRGANVRDGLRIAWRDGGSTSSPNAGRPMATMAGLLGVVLAKEGEYRLGSGAAVPSTVHVTRAWRIASTACALAWLMAAAILMWSPVRAR